MIQDIGLRWVLIAMPKQRDQPLGEKVNKRSNPPNISRMLRLSGPAKSLHEPFNGRQINDQLHKRLGSELPAFRIRCSLEGVN